MRISRWREHKHSEMLELSLTLLCLRSQRLCKVALCLQVASLALEICNNSFATITLESARKLYLEEPMGCTACGIWGAVAMTTCSQQYLESDVCFSALPLGLAALFLLAPFTEQPAPFLHSCTLEIPHCYTERAEPRGL